MIPDVVSILATSNIPHNKGKGRMIQDFEGIAPSVLSHLYPADCSSLLNAMKSLVTSFVDKQEGEDLEPSNGLRCKFSSTTFSLPAHDRLGSP